MEARPSRPLMGTAWGASLGEGRLSHDQVRMYRGTPVDDAGQVAKVLEVASVISLKTQM